MLRASSWKLVFLLQTLLLLVGWLPSSRAMSTAIYFPDTPRQSPAATSSGASSPVEDPGHIRRAIKAGAAPSEVGNSSPAISENDSSQRDEPSRCVWAIISCCTPNNNKIRYTCFELLGCQGAFWDNPCTKDMTYAAANSAQKFYDTDNKNKQ